MVMVWCGVVMVCCYAMPIMIAVAAMVMPHTLSQLMERVKVYVCMVRRRSI